MSELPFILPSDLKANYLAHKSAVDAAAKRVLESGWYIGGAEVEAFETAFAAFVGTSQAIGTGSGTDALTLALRACGVGPGDVVVTVSHTAVATVAAIELTGATAALVDIEPERFTMDPACLARALDSLSRSGSGPVKAIIPVHLYGQAADLPAILDVAAAHGCQVIEDCAQAHGATLQGRAVGSWGDLGCFSFYPTKNLGALGDAGALTTGIAELDERARLLREYGWKDRYISAVPGMNTRLDPLQAAMLGAKLPALGAENEARRQIAARYSEAFRGSSLLLPICHPDAVHVYHQYVIRHPQRDALQGALKAKAIGSLIHYPVPVHLQPAYRDRLPLPAGPLRVTEEICGEILSLPMHPQLTEAQVVRVIDAIREWDGY